MVDKARFIRGDITVDHCLGTRPEEIFAVLILLFLGEGPARVFDDARTAWNVFSCKHAPTTGGGTFYYQLVSAW